jgi:hypothetical protein
LSTHRIHDPIETHGLADECERCKEHAEHPLRDLDSGNLSDLLTRIINKEKPRSSTEDVAMYHVKVALDQACSLAQVNPLLFAKYAKTKWGVRLIAVL